MGKGDIVKLKKEDAQLRRHGENWRFEILGLPDEQRLCPARRLDTITRRREYWPVEAFTPVPFYERLWIKMRR